MKWEGREESENVEDRRGMGMKAGAAIGGGSLLVLLIAMIVGPMLGLDPRQVAGVLGGAGGPAPQEQGEPGEKRELTAEEQRMGKFASTILRDTEVVWDDLFRQQGKQYRKPKMVLFSDQVRSACGSASAEVGPFYCPADSTVYIDLSFYDVMEKKMRAGGEFARAYVLAHEVGHHVQRLLGYSQRADEARGTANENKMSVRLELQADYLAGVWAHHAQKRYNFLEEGDVESAMNAAQKIGDDYLQKQATGRVMPEKFTHGTSAQRAYWFGQGLKTGDVARAGLLFSLPESELSPPPR